MSDSQNIDPKSFCCNCKEELVIHESIFDNDSLKLVDLTTLNNSKLSFAQGNTIQMIAKSDSPSHVPMCKDCHALLVDDLYLKTKALESQNNSYRQCLLRVTESEEVILNEETEKEKFLEELQVHEQRLIDELNKLEKEEAFLYEEISNLELEEEKVRVESNKLFGQLKNYHREMVNLSLKKLSTKLQDVVAVDQLNDLLKTNLLNKTFFIDVNEKDVGRINNLQLGRLPDNSIPLNEFNAAWGQCVLCLQVLFDLLKLNSYPYQLIPMGCQSMIRETTESGVKDYKLYESSWGIFKPSIDDGILAFIKCLLIFEAEFCSKNDTKTMTIYPFTMKNDKITEEHVTLETESSVIWYSVKMQFQKDERWTKSMRLMLLNLKTAIMFTSSVKKEHL
uniref:Beclin-1 n=1 Tax=Strongyloides papillosus TaxID=174720 RepID=A0A0N5BX75_STREA